MKLGNLRSIKANLSLLFVFLSFFAIAQPTITSFSPLQAKPGDVVTITGTNFNTTLANNIVFFGATKAAVTAATATSITAIVPVSATFAPISVLNIGTGLVAFSKAYFNPIYSPAKTTLTSNDFPSQANFDVGAESPSMAVGDLDGDGKPDVVTINSGNVISVFRNTATINSITTGSFASRVDFTLPNMGSSVTIGDLDGDGKPEIIVLNGGTVSVFRNTATTGSITTSSFAPNVDFVTGTSPVCIAIGDLDGDGKPDLAMAGGFFSNFFVSVLHNTTTIGSITSSSFATRVDFITGNSPRSVAIGDLDGDGKPDLATANYDANTVSVLRNTSTSGSINTGSFATKVDFATDTYPICIAIGDLDGDGKLDLATANSSGSTTISVFRNTATAGSISTSSFATKVDFTAGRPQALSIGDLDGDGKPDLITGDFYFSCSIFHNTATVGIISTGSFAPYAYIANTTGGRAVSTAICDMDGDNKMDIVALTSHQNEIDGWVSVFRNADLTTTWNGSTWSNGTPTNTVNAIIASSTAPASFTCKSLTINSGVSLNTTGITATINGDIANNGNGIIGAGGLTIAANSSLSGNAISFNGTLAVNSGATLNPNNLLTLTSNATNTASVANSAGTINGNVTVQRYIPGGRRVFRFISHPFATNLPLSSLTDNIDITGTGGSPMTATASNSPSAFGYDNTNGNSSLATDPGWIGLTASSNLNAKAGYRFLVRGSKGQAGSLTGGVYTPDPVTLDWTGTLNQGNQIVTLTNNGTNKDYNLIGNPYASPVDLSLLTLESNVNANFSVWNANAGSKGAYVTQAFSSSYILPSGAAFFARTSANTNNTITFTESSKSSGTPTNLLRDNSNDETLILEARDANGNYADQLQFMFNSTNKNYTANNDILWDGEKMTNPEVNFYSFSKDRKKLAIDRRPLVEDSIALGFVANAGSYSIEIKQLPKNNASYYLKDNYLGTQTLLVEQSTINIVVTTDAVSQGSARFELVTKLLPTISTTATFAVTISPNPVKDIATVTYSGLDDKENSSITINSSDGKQMQSIMLGKQSIGKQNINLQKFATGVYIIKLTNGETAKTIKVVKD